MPKTNEKDAYYFPHDCNARNDPKILALRSVFGAEGYGVYFMLVEILREQPDYKLQVTKYLYNTLAMQMQVQKERVQEIVDACCKEFSEGSSTLLVNDGKYLYSSSLLRRMGRVDDISKLRREAARKRWENQPCKDSQDFPESKPDANAQPEDSKEKQSRPKQTRKKQTRADQSRPEQTSIFADFAAGDMDMLAALQGFEEMRKKIKKPMTDRAKTMLLGELQKLTTDRDKQISILDQSTMHNWQSVYDLKDDFKIPDCGRKQASSSDKMDALRDLHDAFSGGDSR